MRDKREQAVQALKRAEQGTSTTNYASIYQAFMDRGISGDQILPRENVFTFDAWKAKGRYVRRGEKGVRVITWIPVVRKDAVSGVETIIGKRPKVAYVFHVTQTEESTMGRSKAEAAAREWAVRG